MTKECAFSHEERKEEIRQVLKNELRQELDDYFNNSPFMVQAEQHYKDHEFVKGVRSDIENVKSGFWRSFGKLLAALIAGAVSWEYLLKHIFGRGAA